MQVYHETTHKHIDDIQATTEELNRKQLDKSSSLSLSPYPLLKASQKEHRFKKFGDNLKDVHLVSDSVTHLEEFWDAINTALKSTLAAPKLLPSYNQLTSKSKATRCLLPPSTDLNYMEAAANFDILGSTLKTHLIKASTITSPKALEK